MRLLGKFQIYVLFPVQTSVSICPLTKAEIVKNQQLPEFLTLYLFRKRSFLWINVVPYWLCEPFWFVEEDGGKIHTDTVTALVERGGVRDSLLLRN